MVGARVDMMCWLLLLLCRYLHVGQFHFGVSESLEIKANTDCDHITSKRGSLVDSCKLV